MTAGSVREVRTDESAEGGQPALLASRCPFHAVTLGSGKRDSPQNRPRGGAVPLLAGQPLGSTGGEQKEGGWSPGLELSSETGREETEKERLRSGREPGPAGDTVGKGEKTEAQRSAGCRY